MVTGRDPVISGLRKRWQFGSSTSQSSRVTGCPKEAMVRARLTAIVVFPVPPFPLAMAIFNTYSF